MLDKQKLRARLEDCQDAGVPMTNYGLFLAYATSPEAFIRAVKPYGVKVPPRLLIRRGKEKEEKAIASSSCEDLLGSSHCRSSDCPYSGAKAAVSCKVN